jgi:hypothetical protein
MPDAPYFASWVAEHINWQFPVVNPWDYNRRYTLQKVTFLSSWAGVLAAMAIEHQKLRKEYPDNKELWFPHKAQFEGITDKDQRNFYKMRHLDLIRACPSEIADRQPDVVDPKTNIRKKGSSGRFQPTGHGFAFLANEISVPVEMVILRNQLVGLSGRYVNMARVLFEWQGFEFAAVHEAPDLVQEPRCQACGVVKIPFYMSEYGDIICHECAPPMRDRFYTDLLGPVKGKIRKMKKEVNGQTSAAQRLAAGWRNQFEDYYQNSSFGVTEEITVDLDVGPKGAVVLSEAALRSFLIRREKRRRRLVEE